MISAISRHPDMVYGTNGFCTALMTEFSGRVIGKRGAAGVYLTGIVGEGIGCAVKIEDGSMGPQYNVTMEFIHWLVRRNKLRPSSAPFVAEENHQGGNAGDENQLVPAAELNIKEFTRKLRNLEKFRVTPSYNSMGVFVGQTQCVEGLFPLEEEE
jgi:hypothetical protein